MKTKKNKLIELIINRFHNGVVKDMADYTGLSEGGLGHLLHSRRRIRAEHIRLFRNLYGKGSNKPGALTDSAILDALE